MDWTIAETVRIWAQQVSDAPAVHFVGGEALSYGDLYARSNQVAAGFRAAGVVPGDRIAVLGKNSLEQVELLIGASKVGAVLTPINWRLSHSEIVYIVNDSGASLLFIDAEMAAAAATIAASVKKRIAIYIIGKSDQFPEYGKWRASQEQAIDHAPLRPDDVAILLYTSGTTGLPKGVMLTSRNLFTLCNSVGPMWALGADTRSVVCMPLFHIGGIIWALAALRFGGLVILMRTFSPEDLLPVLQQERATHINLVPTMIDAMLRSPDIKRYDYSSLKMILYGTAPISRPVLTEAMATFGCVFVQVYGLTETSSVLTQLDGEDHRAAGDQGRRLLSAGRLCPWVEGRIVDPTSLADCGPMEPGEVWVRSAQNMKGYWNNDTATSDVLVADGWLRTGDVGYLDDHGYLFLTDRVKDLIVSGGENIYPAESERVLAEHASVAEVAVIGVPDPKWGETVKAIVVLRAGQTSSEEELIQYVRKNLAHFKCPTSVEFVEALPRNATGKILKRSLREPYWKGRSRQIH